MKRLNNLFQKICSIENLQLADTIARKGKSKDRGIVKHDLNRDSNLQSLQTQLLNKTFNTSAYSTFKIFEPKEREVYKLPYYPDRIVHHAIMNVLEPVFNKIFTSNSYSNIKGKGIHGAFKALAKSLTDEAGTRYCLKLDLKKFYPSIDHAILKNLLRRKFKDQDLLWLLDNIIASAAGIPIGNYLSQYLANFYLSYFDHWIKEVKGIKHYFRYADDIVILAGDKGSLHQLLAEIRTYLKVNLKLTIKENYQIFPVASRSIDFIGYRFYHTHILMRKGIKQRFAAMLRRNPNAESIASYKGWAKHCNSKHLLKKLLRA